MNINETMRELAQYTRLQEEAADVTNRCYLLGGCWKN